MEDEAGMTTIRPFRGWHYQGDVSKLVAPPYDVLTEADKQALLAKSADNIVSVDLPHTPPKQLGPDEAYQAAAEKLRRLQAEGVLIQDDTPAVYAYEQRYSLAGEVHARRVMLCGVRATPFYESIWPHEQTFAGPRADRMRLTEVTQVQMSPIFGFYDDVAGVSQSLWSAVRGEPLARGELNGVSEQLWAVADHDVLATVCAGMVDRKIYIADGHHRYTTAMEYANRLIEAGQIDAQHEAAFVLFALAPIRGGGLVALPTHRLLSDIPAGLAPDAVIAATAPAMDWKREPIRDELFDDSDKFLQPFGRGAMAMLDRSLESVWIGRLVQPEAMRTLEPEKPDCWRGLDVAVLHRLVIDEAIAPQCDGEPAVAYTPHGREVRQALSDGACELAVMLQGTPVEAVQAVSEARANMPHKSTYFYPKLTTGMVLKPLT